MPNSKDQSALNKIKTNQIKTDTQQNVEFQNQVKKTVLNLIVLESDYNNRLVMPVLKWNQL